VWIGVADAGALCAELRANGAKIRHPPTNYPWAYEMQIEDLDGNVLRVGSEPKEGQPNGEWLDWLSTPFQKFTNVFRREWGSPSGCGGPSVRPAGRPGRPPQRMALPHKYASVFLKMAG